MLARLGNPQASGRPAPLDSIDVVEPVSAYTDLFIAIIPIDISGGVPSATVRDYVDTHTKYKSYELPGAATVEWNDTGGTRWSGTTELLVKCGSLVNVVDASHGLCRMLDNIKEAFNSWRYTMTQYIISGFFMIHNTCGT